MPRPYRFAVCNELFGKTAFSAVVKQVRELGYDGLEIAPFTLAQHPSDISPAQRMEVSRTLSDEGLSFVGLHWLMVSPEGLHVTTPDKSLRDRSWAHVRESIDLCADIAGSTPDENGVMIFGSPKQRSTVNGATPDEAARIFTDELAQVAPQAESRGVKVLIEALPANQSDVINTLAEAVAIVEQIGSPAVETMFDTHNAVDEITPHAQLVRHYLPHIFHVHVNEIDGREPGMSDYDFASLLAILSEANYSRWVSVEAFDFTRDPRAVAERAIDHLKASLPASAAVAI